MVYFDLNLRFCLLLQAPYNQLTFSALNPLDPDFDWFQYDQSGNISVKSPLYRSITKQDRFEVSMMFRYTYKNNDENKWHWKVQF